MITNYFHYLLKAIIVTSLLFSSYANAAVVIDEIVGDVSKDSKITIRGSGFTDKLNDKPLFWWRADNGITPSTLGRKQSWDSPFQGTPSTLHVAPGSSQSIAWDHGLSHDNALAKIDFASTKVYLHRKFYEDFIADESKAIRTWVNNATLVGNFNPGDTVTGATSGAVGVISNIQGADTEGRISLFYYNNQGTLDDTPPVYFLEGEQMKGPTGNAINIEPFSPAEGVPPGVYKVFNYKTIRFWGNYGLPDAVDIFMSTGSSGSMISPEYTDRTIWAEEFDKNIAQIPNEWNIDEVEYVASSTPDVADAIWAFYKQGVLGYAHPFISRTADRPALFSSIYQTQVSNGAQVGTTVYFDSLYIDDTWHRVIICSGKTLDQCSNREIQIPTNWSDNEITVQLNLGGLNPASSLFLYVVDENGVPNNRGWPLCSKCPLPPAPITQ